MTKLKKNAVLAVTAAMLCSCAGNPPQKSNTAEQTTAASETTESEQEVIVLPERVYPDNAYTDLPQEYFRKIEQAGSIEKFTYTTRNNQKEGSAEFEKYALIYLPYGYDEKTPYNVLYLMHGGSDSPEWFFGGEGENTQLKKVLDNMIANGDCEPFTIG